MLLATFTALVGVGLTAPADSPLSISIHAVFLRVDSTTGGAARPRALGVDIDVKCGSTHVHLGWPGFLLADLSTQPIGRSL